MKDRPPSKSMPPGVFPPVYIVGPTAAGKTRLGIALAQELNGEIVNADSRQVYRCMDIGTAKATPEERRQAVHHLVDILAPDRSFSLGMFLALARQTITEIGQRGALPIVVGGTGQYIHALQEGWEVPEVAPDPEFRLKLEAEVLEKGAEPVYQRLKSIDPRRAAELDPRNVRRLIRALEIHHATGNIPSSYGKQAERAVPGLTLGISLERERLYRRIDRRVDAMMAQGFLDEAKKLTELGYSLGKGPLDCPGYRELGQYLNGQVSLDQAVQGTKFQTHRLARRQYSWFKPGDPRIRWLDGEAGDLSEAAAELINQSFRAKSSR